jgi:hypothetical protein
MYFEDYNDDTLSIYKALKSRRSPYLHSEAELSAELTMVNNFSVMTLITFQKLLLDERLTISLSTGSILYAIFFLVLSKGILFSPHHLCLRTLWQPVCQHDSILSDHPLPLMRKYFVNASE